MASAWDSDDDETLSLSAVAAAVSATIDEYRKPAADMEDLFRQDEEIIRTGESLINLLRILEARSSSTSPRTSSTSSPRTSSSTPSVTSPRARHLNSPVTPPTRSPRGQPNIQTEAEKSPSASERVDSPLVSVERQLRPRYRTDGKAILHLDKLFDLGYQEAHDWLLMFELSVPKFMWCRSLVMLTKWLLGHNVACYTEYQPVWLLLSMSQADRNHFLRSTGRPEIKEDNQVRNICQLIVWVKNNCPDMHKTFQQFPSHDGEALNITKLFYLEPKDTIKEFMKRAASGISYKKFLQHRTLGGLMAWLEQQRVVFAVSDLHLLLFMTMDQSKRVLIDDSIATDDARNVDSLYKYLTNREKEMCALYKFVQNLTILVDEVVKGELLERKILNPKFEPTRKEVIPFGTLDMLHMVDKDTRHRLISVLSCGRLKSTEIFESESLIYALLEFGYFNIKGFAPTNYYKSLWNCLTMSFQERKAYAKANKFSIHEFDVRTVGEFFDFMYESRNKRKTRMVKVLSRKKKAIKKAESIELCHNLQEIKYIEKATEKALERMERLENGLETEESTRKYDEMIMKGAADIQESRRQT